jgi:hypothetical protein
MEKRSSNEEGAEVDGRLFEVHPVQIDAIAAIKARNRYHLCLERVSVTMPKYFCRV